VDLRHRTAFAAGHLGGTYGFALSESFVTYLGWLYAWGAPLTLTPMTRTESQRRGANW
jgi:hydroxyacylglutathione hydrolase